MLGIGRPDLGNFYFCHIFVNKRKYVMNHIFVILQASTIKQISCCVSNIVSTILMNEWPKFAIGTQTIEDFSVFSIAPKLYPYKIFANSYYRSNIPVWTMIRKIYRYELIFHSQFTVVWESRKWLCEWRLGEWYKFCLSLLFIFLDHFRRRCSRSNKQSASIWNN